MAKVQCFVKLFILELLAAHALQLATTQLEQESSNSYYKQPMKNIEDVSYVASMTIGGQKLDAVLDTGSFDVEVISTRCGDSCSGDGVDKYYNRNSSKTYHEGDLIQLTSYESGDVLAQSGQELVKFGSLSITGQKFWEVVYAKLDILVYGDFQAIVGVGPPGADPNEVKEEAKAADQMKGQFEKLGFDVPANFSKELYESEVPKMMSVLEMLDTRLFSVCLGRKGGSQGYFVWNDHNPASNPGFVDIDVAGKVTWGVILSDVALEEEGDNDHSVSCKSKTCAAIVDSGTSLIMVPSDVYDDLFTHLKSLGASCDDLDSLPTLSFKLAGKEIRLPPSAYMGLVEDNLLQTQHSPTGMFPFAAGGGMSFSQTQNGQSCELLIGKIDVDTQLGPMFILGMPFFREYYTTFQLGSDLRDKASRQLFLAKADDHCEPEKKTALNIVKRKLNPMSVKTKNLRVPKWAMKAHHKGHFTV